MGRDSRRHSAYGLAQNDPETGAREIRLEATKRAPRAAFWTLLSVIGLTLIAVPETEIYLPVFLYNPSQSAPPGWYRIEHLETVSRGDLVASNLPEPASAFAAQRGYLPPGIPVIKTIRALEGDTICGVDGVLQINGMPAVRMLQADRAGRPLPSPWTACRQLQTDEVLLLSDRIPDSFDGRYFGTVLKTDILGRAFPIRVLDSAAKMGVQAQFGGDFECKIKAYGAKEGLVPCLHIDFYGSTPQDTALWSERSPNRENRLAWFHAHDMACFPPEQAE